MYRVVWKSIRVARAPSGGKAYASRTAVDEGEKTRVHVRERGGDGGACMREREPCVRGAR